VIDRADDTDFIFQTSDPARTWVRYCLQTPLGADTGRLWEATWATPAGNAGAPVSGAMRGTCPGTGWTTSRIVAESVVNTTATELPREVFSYTCTGGGSACALDATHFDEVIGVSAQLYVDSTPGRPPTELRVSSSVYLRNQNQAPSAQFEATAAGTRTVILNGSGSADTEGRALALYWFKGAIPAASAIRCDQTMATLDDSSRTMLWGGVLIGQGITLTHQFPAGDGAAGSAQSIALVVCDPGGRSDIEGPRAVTIPA
jgi:hypothetical protein